MPQEEVRSHWRIERVEKSAINRRERDSCSAGGQASLSAEPVAMPSADGLLELDDIVGGVLVGRQSL